jgi:diguanylate cyclase (GGDEF)-like protein
MTADAQSTPLPWSAPSAEEVAAAAGAADLFVLRRIAPDRFAHIGGVGRGAGWAGIVEIDELDLEPLTVGGDPVTTLASRSPVHIFGPYWASWAAAVTVDRDVLVVFGGPAAPTTVSDDELRQLAAYAAEGLVEVTPAKRLADELEALTAVRELLSQPPETTQGMLQRLVEHATRALSCELGVAYLSETNRIAVCDLREGERLDDDVVQDVATRLARRDRFPACIQQAATEDLPSPFSAADGAYAYYLLELKEPTAGILLLLHTTCAAPRGFTGLCQSLGRQLVEAAQPLLAAAQMRDHMQLELRRAEADARRDPLTDLGNRLAWLEACARTTASPDRPAAIVIVDGGGLKHINETYGYHVGDDVLRLLARTLSHCLRASDQLARLGGDEFAILLHDADEDTTQTIVDRIRAAVAAIELPNGPAVEIACGWAIDRQGSLEAAQKAADTRMIADKQRRVARQPAQAG